MQQGGAIPGRTRRAGGPRGQKRGSVALRVDLHESSELSEKPDQQANPGGEARVRKAEKGDEKTGTETLKRTLFLGPQGQATGATEGQSRSSEAVQKAWL